MAASRSIRSRSSSSHWVGNKEARAVPQEVRVNKTPYVSDLGRCDFCGEKAIVVWPADVAGRLLDGKRSCDECSVTLIPLIMHAARRELRDGSIRHKKSTQTR